MPERLNILLITTDQQRFDTLQCAGNANIWTPHLNWLCDNGIRFNNAYSDCMYLHYLRSGCYKLCRETLGGHELLFDLTEDPYEQRNLLANRDIPPVADQLRVQLDQHLAENNLNQPSVNDHAVAVSDVYMPRGVHPGLWSGRQV